MQANGQKPQVIATESLNLIEYQHQTFTLFLIQVSD